MIGFFQRLLWAGRYPWAIHVVEGSLRPLRFLRYREEHLAACLELHDQNLQHGIPEGHRSNYLESLSDEKLASYVALDGDRIVGTFGVSRPASSIQFLLCYVLVAPEEQRKGVGTTMFFAALAMLPQSPVYQYLYISAVPTAVDFYRRFGFAWIGDHEDGFSGQRHKIAELLVTEAMRKGCRRWLQRVGAILPEGDPGIPKFIPPPEETPS